MTETPAYSSKSGILFVQYCQERWYGLLGLAVEHHLPNIHTDTIFQQESTTTVYTETYDDPENIITHLHQLHFSAKYQYSH